MSAIVDDLEKHRREKLDQWALDTYDLLKAADVSTDRAVMIITYLLTIKLTDLLAVVDRDPAEILMKVSEITRDKQRELKRLTKRGILA